MDDFDTSGLDSLIDEFDSIFDDNNSGGSQVASGPSNPSPYNSPTPPPQQPPAQPGGYSYGQDVYQNGQLVGQATFDPVTGEPMQNPNTNGATTPSGNTGTPPSNQSSSGNAPIDTSTPQGQLEQVQADYESALATFQSTIDNIQNGAIPLSAGEQAQIAGLQSQFQQAIDQQKLANSSATGAAKVNAYRMGAGEDANFMTNVNAIVSAGLGKVTDLNVKMASEVANLTQAFKDHDIALVKDKWNAYVDFAKDRETQLQKTIDDAAAAFRDARDFAYKQQQDALDRYEKQQAAAKEIVLNDELVKQQATDFIKTIEGALSNKKGLTNLVGPNALATPQFAWSKGAQQEFAASVHQIAGKLTLQSLINAKASGATFGALSDSELALLAASASKLSDWEIKDKNGIGTGVWKASEASVKAELEKIKQYALLDYYKKTGTEYPVEYSGYTLPASTSGFSYQGFSLPN
jgi:hypothetical protein